MIKKNLFIIFTLFLFFSTTSFAYPTNSTIGHLYFGLGPNFNLRGNVRLGFKSIELGIIQESGYGVMYVHRTNSAFFYQIGAILSNGGAMIGGGGLEWDTSSFFRFRTDLTVKTNQNSETEGYVSFGGVFIL